jgi:hypothetical protein
MTCPTGTIGGFPITSAKNLYDRWTTSHTDAELKKLETPYDLTISWSKIPRNRTFRNEVEAGSFSRLHISPYSDSTITLNNIMYSALNYISLVNAQNSKLVRGNDATQELIWAFKAPAMDRIPGNNPHLILICRAGRYVVGMKTDQFWQAVETSFASTTKTSDIRGEYDLKILFPTDEFNAYETCMTVGTTTNYRIRVYVIPRILDIPLTRDSATSEKCSSVMQLSLKVDDAAFNNTNRLLSRLGENFIRSWDDVKKYIQVQKNTLLDYSATTRPASSPRKNFKCYTIDPDKDIVGDQITIDPSTGQPLSEYLNEDIDAELQPAATPSWLTVGNLQQYGIYIGAGLGVCIIVAGLIYICGVIFKLMTADWTLAGDEWWKQMIACGLGLGCLIAATGIIAHLGVATRFKKEGFTNTIHETKDKRCYTTVTGRFIGTKVTMLKGPNKGKVIVSYTQDECENQLGGHYKPEETASGDVEPSSFSGPVGFCYSVDPKVVIPLSSQDYSVTICAPKVIKPPPPLPNLQCYKTSDAGPELIGKEYKLSKLGLESYRPLESIISYTQDECDRLAGLYKEIVVPNTFVTDTDIKTNSVTFGFCYKWGTDLRNPTIDKKRNFSFLCSPSYVP